MGVAVAVVVVVVVQIVAYAVAVVVVWSDAAVGGVAGRAVRVLGCVPVSVPVVVRVELEPVSGRHSAV